MIVTRFAPSPTGFLHLGHAYTAFNAWKQARDADGQFLLRIEDIDANRCRPHFATAIEEDLTWLGLTWDGPVRRQSEHMSEYQGVLSHLTEARLLYPCFCTRSDIAREVAAAASAPHGPDGMTLYPGTCRRLSDAEREGRMAAGQLYALRLNMGAAYRSGLFYNEVNTRVTCDPSKFGDVVLARKGIPASYHLCVTHDDAIQGVTLVSRGDDLRAVTDLHRLLQHLLGWKTPLYAHHHLLTNTTGQRLSKRDGAATLRSLREAGVSATAVIDRFESMD